MAGSSLIVSRGASETERRLHESWPYSLRFWVHPLSELFAIATSVWDGGVHKASIAGRRRGGKYPIACREEWFARKLQGLVRNCSGLHRLQGAVGGPSGMQVPSGLQGIARGLQGVVPVASGMVV